MVMKKWFPNVMIGLDILVFLGFGIAFLVAPAELLAAMDITLGSASSYVEIRAMYGGVELGIALFLLGTVRGWVTKRQALALGGLALGGLGGVRCLGVLMMPDFDAMQAQFTVVELIGAASNFVAWRMCGDD